MDALIGREPFFEQSDKVIKICADEKIDVNGFLAAHTVTNTFYLIRKRYSNEATRELLINLFNMLEIVQIDSEKIRSAILNKEFKDFEDCLQVECAKSIQADYIVTRDAKDFENSEIKCLTPEEFCNKFEEDNE